MMATWLAASCDPPEVSRAAQEGDTNGKYECVLPHYLSLSPSHDF